MVGVDSFDWLGTAGRFGHVRGRFMVGVGFDHRLHPLDQCSGRFWVEGDGRSGLTRRRVISFAFRGRAGPPSVCPVAESVAAADPAAAAAAAAARRRPAAAAGRLPRDPSGARPGQPFQVTRSICVARLRVFRGFLLTTYVARGRPLRGAVSCGSLQSGLAVHSEIVPRPVGQGTLGAWCNARCMRG